MDVQEHLEAHAELAAQHLISRHPSVDAVLLYGSVARASAKHDSDIDLFVVVTSGNITVRRLLTTAAEVTSRRLGIVAHQRRHLREYLGSGTRFVEHLYLEGRVLEDRSDELTRLMALEPPPVASDDELKTELERLEVFADPEPFNGNFLFCYARVYTIAKAVVMAKLASNGVFEFDRERAFKRFATRWPESAHAVDEVTRLRPFYALVNDREPGPLPFHWTGDGRQLQRSVRATRQLADV
jgi:predicted nucleotidyltransferase